MQVDALALQLRPRPMYEAADLGVRLAQSSMASLRRCFLPVGFALCAVALACHQLHPHLPMTLIFFAKPWLDRTILFVLARAAFGLPSTWTDLWRSRRAVWAGQWVRTLTLRRLSPWRSFTQPVFQLEGLRGPAQAKRAAHIRQGKRWVASLVTSLFALIEVCLVLAFASLVLWFAPPEHRETIWHLMDEGSAWTLAISAIYAAIVLVVEPFYVAAGFVMYLNRRVESEAWDIEQELRHVFR